MSWMSPRGGSNGGQGGGKQVAQQGGDLVADVGHEAGAPMPRTPSEPSLLVDLMGFGHGDSLSRAANDKPSAVSVRIPRVEMAEWRRSRKLVFWDARECAPGPQGRPNRPPSTIPPGVGRRRRPIDGR
jgi:hypothetical protein